MDAEIQNIGAREMTETKSCLVCGEKHNENLNTCSAACLNIQMMQQTRVERLLEMYWNIMNRAPLQRRPHTESELHRLHRYEAEMLFRVDQRIMPADALPPSVYQTWCGIMRQEKPSNWEVDCGNACGVQDPYGWVPEDGCPVHDADEPINPPVTDDSSGIEISGDMCTGGRASAGDACSWCSLVQCRLNPGHREWIGENRMKSARTFGIDVESARGIIDELRMSGVDRRPSKEDFGIPVKRVRDRITELQAITEQHATSKKEPAEIRCGITLLLGKLAAVADAYKGLSMDSTRGQDAAQLAQLAIKASAEIFESNECLGLNCDQCGHWAPKEKENVGR